MAMVKPWEDQTGAKVQYTGTRDINNILSTGIQSGLLPDLAGLPGPGQMAEYVQAGALKPLNDVIDMTAYTADTAPGLVTLGTVNDQLYGIFIKADIKGLFWYNTGVYKDGAPATYDDLLAKGKTTADRDRRRRQDLLRRPRVRRGQRLAGLRLGRAVRPQRQRPGRLRQVGRRPAEVDLARDQVGVRGVRQRHRQHVRRRQERQCHELRRLRRQALLDPARLRLRQPRHVHHGRVQEDGRRDGRPVRLRPVPDDEPGLRRCGRRLGRPVRHVQRHAAGQVAHRLPGHARSPGDLGRAAAAPCRPTSRSRPTRTTS